MNYNFDNIDIKEKINNNLLDNTYKFSLGCHSYYIDNITKLLEEKKQFNKKKKIYHILNPFNITINNYENNNIMDIKTKFNEKYGKTFNKQEYFKIFEIIKELNINNKQSIMCFDNYTNEICTLLNLKCDQYDINNLQKINKKYDIIFANIKLKFTTHQEQSLYPFLINIVSCLKYLNDKSIFIVKLYNILTSETLSLINTLFSLFDKKSFYIPFTCEIYKNEKYLICKNLNSNKLKNISSIHEIKYKITNKLKKIIVKMNIELIVKQTSYINFVVDYIQKKNYFSTDYEKYLKIQIEKSDFWSNYYLK